MLPLFLLLWVGLRSPSVGWCCFVSSSLMGAVCQAARRTAHCTTGWPVGISTTYLVSKHDMIVLVTLCLLVPLGHLTPWLPYPKELKGRQHNENLLIIKIFQFSILKFQNSKSFGGTKLQFRKIILFLHVIHFIFCVFFLFFIFIIFSFFTFYFFIFIFLHFSDLFFIFFFLPIFSFFQFFHVFHFFQTCCTQSRSSAKSCRDLVRSTVWQPRGW